MNPESTEDSVELYISYLNDKKLIKFEKSCIVSKALILICNYIAVDRIEACGLCYPDSIVSKNKKHKQKDGSYRDVTVWLDANHSFKYYMDKQLLQPNDHLVLKVKNKHLNKSQKVRVIIPSQGNAEIEVKYDYITTVKNIIDRLLHIEDTDNSIISESWALLLVIGRLEGKIISLWLDPTRTTHSYSLHDPDDETHLRLLVLTQNPKELQKLKIPIKENDQELWWLYQMQRNKWADFSPEVNYSKFEKLKSQVRKGVPGPLRGDIWFIITGARELREPGKYEEYCEQEPNDEDVKRIGRDLHRTLPFHPYFQDEIGKNQLCKVLVAITNHLGKLSYCQGMNYIMGVLLLTMNEECAFWTFLALMKHYSMRLFFDDNVPLLSTSLAQFEMCVKEMFPDLYNHLVEQDILMNTFATSWFLTLFSQQGQLEFVQQLWDCFFNEGFSIIFRVAIALLGESRDLAINLEMEHLKDYFQSAPAQITNPDIILNAAFKIEKNKYMLKVYNSEELETLEKGGKEAKKLILTKEESRLVSGMYTIKGSKATQQQYMSSVVGGNTTAERIRDNNVTVLTAVNKTYDASSMSTRGRIVDMGKTLGNGPLGFTPNANKKPEANHSDESDENNNNNNNKDSITPTQTQVDLSKPKKIDSGHVTKKNNDKLTEPISPRKDRKKDNKDNVDKNLNRKERKRPTIELENSCPTPVLPEGDEPPSSPKSKTLATSRKGTTQPQPQPTNRPESRREGKDAKEKKEEVKVEDKHAKTHTHKQKRDSVLITDKKEDDKEKDHHSHKHKRDSVLITDKKEEDKEKIHLRKSRNDEKKTETQNAKLTSSLSALPTLNKSPSTPSSPTKTPAPVNSNDQAFVDSFSIRLVEHALGATLSKEKSSGKV